MNRYLPLVFTLLASTMTLGAKEVLVKTNFGSGEMAPVVYTHSGEPVPTPEVLQKESGTKEVPNSLLRLDDSEANPEAGGHYALTIPFPPVDSGVVVLRTIFRVSEMGIKGANDEINFRFSTGGLKGAEGVNATYIRVVKQHGKFILSVYDPDTKSHRRINVSLEPEAWYSFEKKVDVGNGSYDWKIQEVGSSESVKGEGERFYQDAENLSFVTFSSTGRGGALEIAEVVVE